MLQTSYVLSGKHELKEKQELATLSLTDGLNKLKASKDLQGIELAKTTWNNLTTDEKISTMGFTKAQAYSRDLFGTAGAANQKIENDQLAEYKWRIANGESIREVTTEANGTMSEASKKLNLKEYADRASSGATFNILEVPSYGGYKKDFNIYMASQASLGITRLPNGEMSFATAGDKNAYDQALKEFNKGLVNEKERVFKDQATSSMDPEDVENKVKGIFDSVSQRTGIEKKEVQKKSIEDIKTLSEAVDNPELITTDSLGMQPGLADALLTRIRKGTAANLVFLPSGTRERLANRTLDPKKSAFDARQAVEGRVTRRRSFDVGYFNKLSADVRSLLSRQITQEEIYSSLNSRRTDLQLHTIKGLR